MPDIAPFRALRYDASAVGDLADVMAPPYDVIGDAERGMLESRSPYNIVRLILPRSSDGDDAYRHARALLDEWQAAGVLREDDGESVTVYEQRYDIDGERRVQRGVLAAVRLDEPESGGVLPHERTYDDIVADRLELLRATQTNLDTIFCVYDGQDAAAHEAIDALCATDPIARFTTDDGIEHLLWRMSDHSAIAALGRTLEKSTIVIADGHHRWRTAGRYRDERRAVDGPGPWDAQLMFLVDASRWGPSLLPIHRTVAGLDPDEALQRLEGIFRIEPAPADDPQALANELAERRAGGRCYAMLASGRAWWLTVADETAAREAMPAERSAAWRDLDVAVLHHVVFDRLLGGVTAGFVHSPREAAEAAERDGVAFLLAPMPFDAVRAVAETGEAMPQKSTYFIPKPKTGVVLRRLEGSGMGHTGR